MEQRLDHASKKNSSRFAVDVSLLTAEETLVLVQDLRTHQIELEMQNEELRHAQEELDASRARYFDFYDLAPVGYVTVSESGLILDANLTFARLLGTERGALAGQPLSRFILRDDRDSSYLHRKKVISTGEQHGSTLRMVRTDGSSFWGHLAAVAAEDSKGDPVVRVVVTDVTERLQTEELLRVSGQKYRIVADNTYDWEFWMGPDGHFLYNSPACRRATGLDAEVFVTDPETLMRITHDKDRDVVSRHLHACDLAHVPGTVEFRIIHTDGTIRWIEHFCIPVFDDNGTFLGSRGSNRDVTERRVTEDVLRDVQRRESIRVLSSGIAHDYNNLLGIMMGNVSLAQSQLPADHAAGKNIEKALAAMERAAELNRQMLAYSGKGKYRICTVDLGALILEHEHLFRLSLPKKVTFTARLPQQPVRISADPAQIGQVVTNLIINAGDAIGSGQGCVSVSVSEVSMGAEDLVEYGRIPNSVLTAGTYAVLEVADNGAGMDRDTVTKIFDPFFTTRFTGRGLGLSAVLGIIQGHKAGITVESERAKGTVFRCIFPGVADPAATGESPAGAATVGHAATGTILVIDDEEDVATMAQEILQAGKYTAVVEVHPMKAVEFFERNRRDVSIVLLDLTMPEMSGREVVDALQKIDPDVKIIITSGYSEEEVVQKLGAAKVETFIQKPYRLKSLLAVVDGVMARRPS